MNETDWDMTPGHMLDYTVQVGWHEYKVWEKDQEDAGGCKFILCGPRNSRYILMPNRTDQRLMFPINFRNGSPRTVLGNSWFTFGEDGHIRECRVRQ